MPRQLTIALVLFTIVLAGGVVFACIELHAFRLQLTGLVGESRSLVAKEAAAQDAQLAFIHDIQSRTKGLIGELNIAAKSGARTMQHFESTTAPKIDASVDRITEQSGALVQSAQKPLHALTTVLDDFDRGEKQTFQLADSTLTSIRDVSADPVWKELPASLQRSAANFEATTGEAAASGKNVTAGTASLAEILKTGDIATRELRKPAGKLKALGKFLLGFFHHNI